MFRQSKIDWDKLLKESTEIILKKYGITEGSLELDDTERERSKNAKELHHLGKHKDKKSGGYFNGQSIVFLLLVSDKVSIPVDFKFYKMDPRWKAWKKEDDRLKKQKVKKSNRPPEPPRDPKYPTKNKIGLELVKCFKRDF
ncbi:MAG: transposase, partial [Saprospiraceae bacterium]